MKGGDKNNDDKRVSWKYGVSGSRHIRAWGNHITDSELNVIKTGGRKNINPTGLDLDVL